MEALVNAVSEFLAAIFARFGYIGKPRRRAHLRDEIRLLNEFRESPAFGVESNAARHLTDHISQEVARYSGVIRKRKIPWGSVALSAVIGLPLSYLTYTMVQNGFVWYAIFPGAIAGFFVVGGLALLFTGDESLPDGAEVSESLSE